MTPRTLTELRDAVARVLVAGGTSEPTVDVRVRVIGGTHCAEIETPYGTVHGVGRRSESDAIAEAWERLVDGVWRSASVARQARRAGEAAGAEGDALAALRGVEERARAALAVAREIGGES